MDKEEETTEPNQDTKQPEVCEECKSNPSKYKCPGCFVRSCSIGCVNAHKLRTGCDGKRKQTKFVPKSQFDDNLLISDYNLLEEIKRVADSSQRKRVKLCGQHYFKPPFHLRSLRSAASQRRTRLLFLPNGMSRRERNKSIYDQRNKAISWTIEWRFHSTDVVLLDHGVHDNLTPGSIIENHLQPSPWNHKLKKFCDEKLESLKIFIRKYPKGPSPFRELNIKAPISQQLANIIILEYPVIHVFLPSHTLNFEVIKDINPRPHKPDYNPIVKGVPFKEEQIEDDDSSDPRVLDLTKHITPKPVFQNHKKEVSDKSKAVIGNDKREDGKTNYSIDSNKPGDNEEMDFKFDPELLNAYSDLIEEINTGDFLEMEGDFVNEMDLENQLDFGPLFPVHEELEEGELPP